MNFDVVISNPPYQVKDKGFGSSAKPIYHQFIQRGKRLNPRYLVMIIPSRWFAGGKGLDRFRKEMLNDNRIRCLDDYPLASEVFPEVKIEGGVCYFLWVQDYRGTCRITTHLRGGIISTVSRSLKEEGVEVFIRFNEGLPILRKIAAVENEGGRSLSLPEGKRFDRLVSPMAPFGLETKFRGNPVKQPGDVLVYQNGGTGYVPREAVQKSSELIDRWKVYVCRAGSGDAYPHKVIGTPFIGEPGSISSGTYLCIGPLGFREQAESVLSYLCCRLTRFLILLRRISQDTSRKVYAFVPTQEWEGEWTDDRLYRHYGLSKEEITFIESMIRPMDAGTRRATRR